MPRRSDRSAPRYVTASIFIVALLAAAVVILAGCAQRRPAAQSSPAGGSATTEGPANVEGEPARVEGKAAAFETAAVASDESAALSLLEGLEIGQVSGEAFAASGTASLGQKLTLRGGTAVAVIDGEKQEMLQVRTEDGLEGYVPSSYIARKSGLAVVVSESATLYSKPEEGSARPDRLPAGTVLAVSVDTMEDAYSLVSLVLPGIRRAYQGVYARTADLSFRKDDVDSAILMGRAASTEDSAQGSALLKQTLRDHPSSRFVVRIEEMVASLAAEAPGSPTGEARASEPFFASMVTTADNVEVRSLPDEKVGEIVKILAKGAAVEVEAKTTSDYEVGGQSSPWYRIREPKGWVYGASVGVEYSFATPMRRRSA